jgi:beta-galactosidase
MDRQPRTSALAICSLLALVSATGGALHAQTDAALPAGVRAVWDMGKAWHQATPTRERVCINGLWRWQPADEAAADVPAGNWGFFKVPGPWPGIGSYMQKDTQTLYRHPAWQDVNLGGVRSAWYQREITVPEGWAGRRIALAADCLNSYADIFIDGKKAGSILFPGGEADITAACRPGATQLLSLHVTALPLSDVVMLFTDTGAPRRGRGSVERRGLCGDVCLLGTPRGARFTDVKVDTSVRKWQITLDTGLDDVQPGGRYELAARIKDGDRTVKKFTSAPFGASDVQKGRFSFSADWKPDKLWDTNTPQNTYTLEMTLTDDAGHVLDVFRPVRFGFREFWIEGRDFYLNGTRLYIFLGSTDAGLYGTAWATYDAARESMLRLKSIGINAVNTAQFGCQPGSHLAYSEILRAADDVGMLIAYCMPHEGHYRWDAPDAAETNGYARHAEYYVRVVQNHPSVVLYAMNHNSLSYAGSANPQLLDGKHNAEGQVGPRRDSAALRGLLAQSIVEGFDPTRVVYHHDSGTLGHAHTNNLYLDFTPIQEVSDRFEHWATEGIIPLILCEYDTPYDLDWTNYRGWYQGHRSWGSDAVPWEYLVAEWGSQFLGDQAFDLSESDKANIRWEANKWNTAKTWYRWDYPSPIVGASSRGNANKNAVRAMYITDNFRAFRTWGVSAFDEFTYDDFWSLKPGVDRGRVDFKVDWDNIQKPGYSPDYIRDPYTSMVDSFKRDDWVPSASAEALYRNTMPLLAYIGGKPERFTTKDHNFLPGESFQKQLIVINNSRVTVDGDCTWSLGLPQPQSGGRSVTIQTGNQERIPMQFALPADLKPGSYALTASVEFSSGETQKDTFQVDVLAPAPPLPQLPRVALLDPKGETAALLKDLGVQYQAVDASADLKGYDVLIIGKQAVTVDGAAPDVGRVRDGLKVIMFEQTANVLEKRFGFRVEEYGLRRVFARVPDHPLLKGLTNADLCNWRGAATLTPPLLEDYTVRRETGELLQQWCGIEVTRSYRCGNWGNVASVLIERPARGDFLPVVDGGFSLEYSPLMVYREGKGLMLLCQMDVTGRSESNPAARRLAANIISYVAGYTPAPHRKALYAGEAAGLEHLEQAGFDAAPYQGGPLSDTDVLVVGPGGADTMAGNADVVRSWLKAGGRLLAIGQDGKDASAFLPSPVRTQRAEHISTVFDPQGESSPLAGVGPADVNDRDPKQIDLVSGGATVLGDGVLAEEDPNVVLCQLAPWQFDHSGEKMNDKRTFRRLSCLVTRVLGNMGCEGSTPLLERVSSPVKAGEAQARWLDGFYLDRPQEFDDPYRFFGW